MNIEGLRQKLLAAARAHPPDDRVPYAFEKRIAALIAGRPLPDHWALWVAPLWRAAASCVTLVILLTALSMFNHPHNGNTRTMAAGLDQDYDQTMFAAMDQSGEAW